MRHLFLVLLIGTVIGSLYSCQREIDWGISTSNSGDFRARVDGAQWVATTVKSASRISGILNITGKSADKKTITITVLDSGIHHYTLNQASLGAAAYQDSTLPSVLAFTSNGSSDTALAGGSLDITSIDTVNKKISGTFRFRVYRVTDSLKRNITEGVFENLSYSTSLPPSAATDTLHVKVNGTLFTPPTILAVSVPAINPLPAQIAVTGTDLSTSRSLGLTFPADITPGTYSLSFIGGTYIAVYGPDNNPNNTLASVAGSLQILEHNTGTKRIRGNFNFTGSPLTNPLNITLFTQGYFSVKYQ